MADIRTYIKNLMKAGQRPSVSILLMACLPVAQAELYKWVDQDGQVNYTQSPPPADTRVTTIKPPPAVMADPANERLQQRLQTLDQLSGERQKQAEQKQKSGQQQAEQQRICDQAKSRLASYERPRVSVAAPGGDSRILGEEERLAEIANARGQVLELCK